MISKAPERSGAGGLPDDFQGLLDNSDAHVRAVIDQARDIVLGHLGELLLKYAFQSCEDDGAVPLSIVVDDTELYLAVPLLDDGRLLGEGDYALLRLCLLDIGRGFARMFVAFGGGVWVEGLRGFALHWRWNLSTCMIE